MFSELCLLLKFGQTENIRRGSYVHKVKYNIKKKRNVVVYKPTKEVFSGYIGITLFCPSVHMSRIRKPS